MWRVVEIKQGVAMVITDLHGEGNVYFRLRDWFLNLRQQGRADHLIICGDLIHGYGPEETDASLDMLLDVMQLQREIGREHIILLLGNHEMPHIYGISLTKGDLEFTPRFEASLARLDQMTDVRYRRDDVIQFLSGLPFYVCTSAGVLLTHAGATPVMTTPEAAARVLDWDHESIIEAARQKLSLYDLDRVRLAYVQRTGAPYEAQARHYLAVSGPGDPRYNDLLYTMAYDHNADFELIWEVLFARNEADAGLTVYEETVKYFLWAVSDVIGLEQRMLVAGHIGARGGCAEIGHQHLRLATYAHAHPGASGRYLLLDCEKRVDTVSELLPGLRRVFGES